jgi:hypothetical protein
VRKLLAKVASIMLMLMWGIAFAPMAAVAASDADKAALQKATADCRAQVKEYARYHETYWYQRHKMLKKCINDTLSEK